MFSIALLARWTDRTVLAGESNSLLLGPLCGYRRLLLLVKCSDGLIRQRFDEFVLLPGAFFHFSVHVDELADAVVLVATDHAFVVVTGEVDDAAVTVDLVVDEETLLDRGVEFAFGCDDSTDALLLFGTYLKLTLNESILSFHLAKFVVSVGKINVDFRLS